MRSDNGLLAQDSPQDVVRIYGDLDYESKQTSRKGAANNTRLMFLPGESPAEATWKRRLYLLLALGITAGFFFLVHIYYAPAPGNPGIDENAYLVAGKNIAQHFSPFMHPDNPYAYVGPMWMITPQGWYYPKYPLGVPVLNAIAIWLGGGHNNLIAFYTSPVCATLAVLGMFFLTRMLAGSFLAILGMLMLATNSIMLQLAIIPSSHAPAICFSLWGMVMLLSWCRSGRILTGIAAGLLLGYAFTTRYTEGLLALPLGIAVLTSIRWTRWRSYFRAAVPVLFWAIPVVALVTFNYFTIGHFTGYDSTHESTGFTLAEFKNKWEYTAMELHLYGLFFLLPLGVMGMLLMFARAWRAALLLVLWFVPSVILYTAYYWGEQTPGVGYLRFFLTLFPPVIAASMWLISAISRGAVARRESQERKSPWARGEAIVIPLVAGVLAGVVCSAGVYVAAVDLERQHMFNEILAFSGKAFLQTVPAAHHQAGKPEPILYCDQTGMFSRVLMYMQFAGDGEWYSAGAFTPGGGEGRGFGMLANMTRRNPPNNANPNDPDQTTPAPTVMQEERREFAQKIYGGKTTGELMHEEKKVLDKALDSDRGIYAMLTPETAASFRRRMNEEGFDCKMLATWTEPGDDMNDQDTPPPPPTRDNANGGRGRGGAGNRFFGNGNGNGNNPRFAPGGRGGRRGMINQAAGLSPPSRGMPLEEAVTLEVIQVLRRPPPAPTPTHATSRPAGATASAAQ